MAEHHAAIDAFLAQHRCEHVYLDVGTNIGVQIRKLYEPTKYPHAGVEPIFAQHFGPAPRCGVCTIGFEPNPVHRHRLQRLESSLGSCIVTVAYAFISENVPVGTVRAGKMHLSLSVEF